MVVYISGKITNNKKHFDEFIKTHALIRVKYYEQGVVIKNPMSLNTKGVERSKCLNNDIFHLLDCTHIAMVRAYYFKIIPKWWFSKEARLERAIAKQVGIKMLKY